MLQEKFYPVSGKEIDLKGYISQLIEYIEQDHFCDETVWKKFAGQFRTQTDGSWKWSGEYWGKAMRGAAMLYRYTQNEKLYHVLQNSVLDLLSTQEDNGRISSYDIEKEFRGWDMWGRKYVLLGCLYFYEICKDDKLKEMILAAMERHLDYIVERIGDKEGQMTVFETSNCWGALNSCSILEPVVKMHKLTGKASYLQFAEYIVSTGFGEDDNYIEACYTKTKYPYQFQTTKAYEMMSCFQGLLELYTVTGDEKQLTSVVNFVDMMQESEITIIGCAGCQGEFLDNSAKTQTEYSYEEMQETCVTVTWMNLCYRLLQLTGKAKYADWIECSALNAMNGSVNTENQLVLRGDIMDYRLKPMAPYEGKRQVLPFDSYSPLVYNCRGKKIGGFNFMYDDEYYGCCACIGGLGLAIEALFGVMKSDRGFVVNLYHNAEMHSEYQGVPATIQQEINLEHSPCAILSVKAKGQFEVALRIPEWTDYYEVRVDGEKIEPQVSQGYIYIEKEWSDNTIELFFNSELKVIELNGKVAFSKGGYVLARTEELEKDIRTPIGEVQSVSIIEPEHLECDIALKVQMDNGEIYLCDYAHAGKKFDEEKCNITVWCKKK